VAAGDRVGGVRDLFAVAGLAFGFAFRLAGAFGFAAALDFVLSFALSFALGLGLGLALGLGLGLAVGFDLGLGLALVFGFAALILLAFALATGLDGLRLPPARAALAGLAAVPLLFVLFAMSPASRIRSAAIVPAAF